MHDLRRRLRKVRLLDEVLSLRMDVREGDQVPKLLVDPPLDAVERAEREVVGSAIGCVDKQGHAYRIATAEAARTFFVDELAMQRLEHAVAKLKEARKIARRKR
jgi:hypothetical protein